MDDANEPDDAQHRRGVEEREIAQRMTFDRQLAAVVLITIAPDGSANVSTVVHAGVADEHHAAIGNAIADVMHGAAETMRAALTTGDIPDGAVGYVRKDRKKGMH